ncbi:uncharacterized protein KY384_002510 [Bacidia gigantensis]|uniref:uncharacterized protein n=1 Tax=Bacidia gigantensis TaxID=2732470 RepID=UPI001D04D60D|nr:uncharacterized protein KY384_002510 [Bacidia gigantensis]KAG8532633.1 hypothetical protein KY384_002510 [Bacidia gigantensis]
MQPHGPLAQLANNNRSIGVNESDPLDEPSAPFASELPVPSDLSIGPESDSAYDDADASATPRLGSPCGFHTWGPSQSKQRYRERLNGSGGSSSATVGPSLLSPLVLRENFPYPGINKRRAYHPLEDEVSPGGSSVLQRSFVDPGRTPTGDRHRRVRSRGFSLGDLHEHHPLQSLFLPENLRIASSATLNIPDLTESTDSADLSPINPIRQLDSPFHGISPRPARRAPRHLAAFSLGAYDHGMFSSISETLGQTASSLNPDDGH